MTKLAKKKRMNMIVMVAVLVILVGALIILNIAGADEEPEGETYVYTLTSLKSGEISKISYEYEDGSNASYKYVDGNWLNADDSEFPMSTSGFENQFVATFVGLSSSRRITEYEGGLEALGLDEPHLTLTVTGVNDVTTTYKVGSYNPSLDEYYLMINDDAENIYTITNDLEYICRKDIYDYASVGTFPTYSTSTLDYMSFAYGDIEYRLMYRADGMEEDITGYNWKWFFDAPFSVAMPCESSKMDTMIDDILPSCEYTKTVNYKATEAELAEYGLDNPVGSYSVYFTDTNEAGDQINCSVTVYIGKMGEDGIGYYTREVRRIGLTQEASNQVSLLSTAGGEAILGLNPFEYIVSNVMFLAIEDINNSTITFTTQDDEYKFSFADGDETKTSDDVYKLGDTVVDSDGFTALWLQMTSIKPERVIGDKSTIKTDEPVYTIAADRIVDDYYGDITVKFVSYDSTYYQVSINENTDMLMRKRDVDKFFNALSEYADSYK